MQNDILCVRNRKPEGAVGPLGRWAVGPLGRWAVGPLGRWAVGPLGRWSGCNERADA